MRGLLRTLLILCLVVVDAAAWAQTGMAQASSSAATGVAQWLTRWHDAARQQAYVGTLVVTAGETRSVARVWHACDGQQQIERVDSLTGPPRSTFRRSDLVVTFLPDRRQVLRETRQTAGVLSGLPNLADSPLAQFYRLRSLAPQALSGRLADVIELVPVDALRFGYRVWTDRQSGLIVQIQTLDASGRRIEQAVYSELELARPPSLDDLAAQMDRSDGYTLRSSGFAQVPAERQDWVFAQTVPGFKAVTCHRRVAGAEVGADRPVMQWVFSDGLASVSVFLEAAGSPAGQQPKVEDSFAEGATHVLRRRRDDWWITAVGEVPQTTLALFVRGLERKR